MGIPFSQSQFGEQLLDLNEAITGPSNDGSHPFGALDLVAGAIGILAVWLETQTDIELHRFRATRASPAEVLASGV